MSNRNNEFFAAKSVSKLKNIMGKKGGRAPKGAATSDSEESGLSLLLVILAAIAGGVLLGLYGSYKDQCKLYGIDASHWNPRNATGNIPKWMSYHG